MRTEITRGEVDDVSDHHDFSRGGVVISSDDELAKKAAEFFVQKNGFEKGPDISGLKDNQTLLIICHDDEFERHQSEIIEALGKNDSPMSNFKIAMLVCSAAEKTCEDGVTYAQELADFLKRDVIASTSEVAFDNSFEEYHGNWRTVSPKMNFKSDPTVESVIKCLGGLLLESKEADAAKSQNADYEKMDIEDDKSVLSNVDMDIEYSGR